MKKKKLTRKKYTNSFASKEILGLEDAIDIREINNIKLANQMLKI